MAQLRNIITHEYFRVNLEIVWRIATVQLDDFYADIADIQAGLDDNQTE